MDQLKFVQDKYDQWFNSLDEILQRRFIYLMRYSFHSSEAIRWNHVCRHKFGINIVGITSKKQNEYIYDEIHNEYIELGKTNLKVNWTYLDLLRDSVKERIENASKNDSQEFFDFENEDEFRLLFWSTVVLLPELNFILNYPVNFTIAPIYNSINIPELKELNEFIGRYLYIIHLLHLELYGIEQAQKKRTLKPKIQTFNELFEGNADEIRKLLKDNGYTKDDIWNGETDFTSELICVYYVLKPITNKKASKTQACRIIFNEFGVSYNDSTERLMRIEPKDGEYKNNIKRIFSNLIKK